MYIYCVTRYYTKNILYLLYNTIQCTVRIQNTLYISGCSCCSCCAAVHLACSTVQNRVSGGFTQPLVTTWGKRTKDCHQSVRVCVPLFAGFGGNCKEFYFIFFIFSIRKWEIRQMAFYLGGWWKIFRSIEKKFAL